MSSVEFAELTELQRGRSLGRRRRRCWPTPRRGVEAAGADLLLMCTTAFHTVADQVEAAVDIPFLHLADVVARACTARGLTHGRAARHVVRDAAAVLRRPARLARPAGRRARARHHDAINRIIYDELVHGKVARRLAGDRRRRRSTSCGTPAPRA